MKRLTTALLTVLAATAVNTAHGAFEDTGAGGRAPGMGNAFTAIADDAYAAYYNPAGLGLLERPELGAGYSRMFMGLSDGSSLSSSQIVYAQPLRAAKRGTVAAAWDSFSLSGLYTEQTFQLGYGRLVMKRRGLGSLHLGATAKYLRRSFQPQPEAYNAMNGLAARNRPDALLSGSTSKGAADLDLGLLHQFERRYSIGLAVKHVARPDVAFGSDAQRLHPSVRLGAGYKALWMNLAAEARTQRSPIGTRDYEFAIAGERYFPTLEYGQFGMRASLAMGSRELRQLSAGFSYRVSRIGVDYGFQLPIGTVAGTAGTHRVSMSFYFGAPTPEEEFASSLLEQARRLREAGRGSALYEIEGFVRPYDIRKPDLEGVRRLIEAGRHRAGHRMLRDYAKEHAQDKSLDRLAKRLELAALNYPELESPETQWERALAAGIRAFLEGLDSRALLWTSYARSLRPNDAKLDYFLGRVEDALGAKALRLPAGSPRSFIDELLFRSELTFRAGDFQKVLELANDILVLRRNDATALAQIGSVYFLLKQHDKALTAWRTALEFESRVEQRAALERHIEQAERARLERKAQQPPVLAPPATGAAPPRPPVRAVDARAIERLYRSSVEHYARGEYLQAAAALTQILSMDPDNEQARKAMARIQRLLPERKE